MVRFMSECPHYSAQFLNSMKDLERLCRLEWPYTSTRRSNQTWKRTKKNLQIHVIFSLFTQNFPNYGLLLQHVNMGALWTVALVVVLVYSRTITPRRRAPLFSSTDFSRRHGTKILHYFLKGSRKAHAEYDWMIYCLSLNSSNDTCLWLTAK
jgi:hypothetical protein